jgi:two-component system LytT family response regulator
MNVLIVDDEKPARDELRLLLGAHPELKIVGEAASLDTARAAIANLRPSAIFLDINLRGSSGFDVLEALALPLPHIIFCTAYDEHAVRAFDVNAVDYLMKPVHPERLSLAVSRLLRSQADRTPASLSGNNALDAESRVFVREGDKCWFVQVQEIHLIEADGNYSRLHFGKHQATLYRSLSSLKERLPSNLFLRANRGQIINVAEISSLVPWFSQSLKATLKTGEEIELSRRASLTFRETMGL